MHRRRVFSSWGRDLGSAEKEGWFEQCELGLLCRTAVAGKLQLPATIATSLLCHYWTVNSLHLILPDSLYAQHKTEIKIQKYSIIVEWRCMSTKTCFSSVREGSLLHSQDNSVWTARSSDQKGLWSLPVALTRLRKDLLESRKQLSSLVFFKFYQC